MKLPHRADGTLLPCTLPTPGSFIVARSALLPIHTAVASWGVNPTNQASPLSSDVPVLPAVGCSANRALPPVPPVTTPWSTAVAWAATSGVNTCSPGGLPRSYTTVPSGPSMRVM